MKKILLAVCLLFGATFLFCCTPKATESKTFFKPGLYEAKVNGNLTYYYSFYDTGNDGSFTDKEGISGLPFRFDVVEQTGNTAKLMFHMGGEDDNTEATVTTKNENEYTLLYKDNPGTIELTFLDSDLNKLNSLINK
jgi:hypothetical protein